MTVDINSIIAYHDTVGERDCKRTIILETVRKATHPSSSDIVRLTGIQRTSVTGRLRELEEDGLIMKAGTKIDPFTKMRVNWYEVVG